MRTLNPLHVMLLVGLLAIGGLAAFFALGNRSQGGASESELFVYCAAGMRYPMEKIAAEYEKEFGVRIELQYAGSNTLLNQLETAEVGDLYLAADVSYIKMAQEKGLAQEQLPLATIRPVIAVAKDDDAITSVRALASEEYRVALANPEAAAVGKKTKKLLTKSGDWAAIEANVTARGVFKPTVNEVANDIKLNVVSAGIVWDSTIAQYPELKAIRTPELDAGASSVTLCVLRSTQRSAAALHFARYVAARDRGLAIFREFGFETVDGDKWADRPTLTFYAGAVNRRAVEDALAAFAEREGVEINTVYNGCGILTADMRSIRAGKDTQFPDAYMACDVYYLDTVQEMFQPGARISSTDIVIVVGEGNPKNIRSLRDLANPGIKLALGQPDQCTIGVLSRRLLEQEKIYDTLLKQNVVTQTATSALLVPTVATGSADAALAYVTDTLAESARVDTISIDSELAQAIQPFSVSLSSDHKHLANRLFLAIAAARNDFEAAGFTWRLEQEETDSSAAPSAKPAADSPRATEANAPTDGGSPGETGALDDPSRQEKDAAMQQRRNVETMACAAGPGIRVAARSCWINARVS